jgi:hypothetical protein
VILAALSPLHAALAADPSPPLTASECEVQLEEVRQENQSLKRRLLVDPPAAVPASDLGEHVRVEAGAVADNAIAFGRDVWVDGRVTGDAVSIGGNVHIGPVGAVDGEAVAVGGRVFLEPGGRLGSSPVELGPSFAEFSREQFAGRLPSPTVLPSPRVVQDTARTLARRAIWTFLAAGVGMLVVGAFPQRVRRVARDLEDRPVRAALVGTLASTFLLAFSVLFTLVTLGFGSPIALGLLALLASAWLLGFVGLCQAISDRLPLIDRLPSRWVAFLVGVAVVTLLASLPWVGWMITVGASLLGIGAALASGFGAARFGIED